MTLRTLRQHPLRAELQAEAHARPPLELGEGESDLWHWVLFDRGAAAPWPAAIDPTKRHQILTQGSGRLRIEQHTEFVACTYVAAERPPQDVLDLIAGIGGTMLTGVQIAIRPAADAPLRDALFSSRRLFGGSVYRGRYTLTTDFNINDEGFVPYLIAGDVIDRFQAGRLVKRIVDIETYRMASLLAFALAREKNARLLDVERRATEISESIADLADEDLEAATGQIAGLLGEATRLRSEVQYRFGAGRAYYDIVEDRLARLAEVPVAGQGTIRAFTELRLSPAIKTVAAFERRLASLNDGLSASMALIQTRLDQQMERQNQELLKSMNRRARQQVLLGQAVEGLSVFAITYYAVASWPIC